MPFRSWSDHMSTRRIRPTRVQEAIKPIRQKLCPASDVSEKYTATHRSRGNQACATSATVSRTRTTVVRPRDRMTWAARHTDAQATNQNARLHDGGSRGARLLGFQGPGAYRKGREPITSPDEQTSGVKLRSS